jgi:hypothetical protein
MNLLPLVSMLAQAVPLGAPVPSLDALAWEPRDPAAHELLLVEMGWLSKPVGSAQFKADSGMLLLLHGIGAGHEAAPLNLDLVQDWFHTEADRGLAVVSVIQAQPVDAAQVSAAQWVVKSGARHTLATVPLGSPWKDSTTEGMLTLISRGGILMWRGTDPEEAARRLLLAYLWPRVLKPVGIPPPVLGEAWARYHDGLWSDARALAVAVGETPLVGPGMISADEFLALLDRHEAYLLKLVRALPSEPALHELVIAARLREPLVRGLPASSATKELLVWFGAQRGRSGGSMRLRVAADWVALGPQRPAGYPRRNFLGQIELRNRILSIAKRARDHPLGRYAEALLEMQP